MKNDELKEIGHETWSEILNYLCIDMTKNRNEGKNRIFNQNKTTYFESIAES